MGWHPEVVGDALLGPGQGGAQPPQPAPAQALHPARPAGGTGRALWQRTQGLVGAGMAGGVFGVQTGGMQHGPDARGGATICKVEFIEAQSQET